jgi:hypothetical protein
VRVVSFTKVEDIPAAAWDAIAPADFFFQRSFLRVMQESGVEQARYRYVMLLEGDTPVGLAVLSAFTLKLDLLASDPWIRRVRQWLPSLLDVPIVCCGIPASYGQHHVHLVRPDLAQDAIRHVHCCMDAWAEEEGCGMVFWKEWNPRQAAYGPIRDAGYLALPTLADHRVRPIAGDVDAFLGSLRSPYRRKYKAATALMRNSGPIRVAGELCLEESPFGPDHVTAFHDGYLKVMSRTRVRLETYPAAFFHGLARSSMDVRILRLTHSENHESLAALLFASGPVLTFALVSKERAHYQASLYTTLLQCIVLYGIDNRFSEVRLGQTSSHAKCSIGAEPWRLETLIRMKAPWKHRLLERFGTLLFPETDTPRFSVFRETHMGAPHVAHIG